jgi:hypothetical protein
MMRKIFLTMVLFIAGFTMLPLFQVQSWNFNQDPVAVLNEVKHEANNDPATRIQNTDLDEVTSKGTACD